MYLLKLCCIIQNESVDFNRTGGNFDTLTKSEVMKNLLSSVSNYRGILFVYMFVCVYFPSVGL